MASPEQKKEAEKQTLYVELLKFSQNQDYERATKTASRILHLYPQDETAFRTKMTCHINRSMYTEALEQLAENPKLCGNLQYEKAYCYYRLQRMEESKDVLEKWKSNSLRKKELMYQIHYRLDMFEEAYDVLSDVIKNSDDDMDEERQTNLSAIEAALKLEKSDKHVKHVAGDTYEMRYNHAVGLIGEGKIIEAEALLNKVEKQAIETLQEDGASEEDIADELGLVTTQRAYCAQLLGRVKEAMAIYSQVLKSKPTDVGLIAVASNNILCINKDQNVFDSKKRIKSMSMEGVIPKLNDLQRRDMLLNQCLFHLYTQQIETCKQLCSELDSTYPDYVEESLLIKAALITRTEGISATKKQMESFLKKNPSESIKINLGLVQQVLRDGKKDEAITLLKDLGQDYYRPGIISALVTLYQSQDKPTEAGKTLKEAVEYYRKSGANKENMKLLWRQTASFMMEQGDPEEAAKSLEELRKSAPDDPVTLAQLIVAYSQINIVKARSLSKTLPPLDQPDVDVGVLESPNWLANVKLAKKGAKGDSVPSSPVKVPSVDVKEKVKKTKKRKNKPPANKVGEPDPERWLPKYERSGYRPKKSRKGRVDVGKGTQGADTAAAANYDMSSKVGQKNVQEESPAQSAAWRKDAHKKKKKKK